MWPEDDILRYRRRTAPRQPWDERLPDGTPAMEVGLRGTALGEMLAGQPNLVAPILTRPREAEPLTGSLGPPPRTMPEPPPIASPRLGGQMPQDASNFQRLMAERQALSTADPSSKVARRDWGYEVMPPEQSPSRLRHAGLGAAHGAIIAGQATQGDPWGTLAGTVVGALGGGISPGLLQAFQRRQELDRNAGELGLEQKLQLQNAQIGETAAQAEQRRLEPYLRAQQLEQQRINAEMLEEGRNQRAELGAKTRVQTATEANEIRRRQLEETERHNKAVESRTPATEEITVAGRKFKVSPNTAARILEERTKAVSKPDKERTEATLEVELETEAANDHLNRRRQADEQASALRGERDKLVSSTPRFQTRAEQDRHDARLRDLDRQITEAERESTYRQKEADDAFMRARKAKAKAGAAANTSPTKGGRSIEGAMEAFRKKIGREPTEEEIARMRRALGQ